jgi:hypothetical protein
MPTPIPSRLRRSPESQTASATLRDKMLQFRLGQFLNLLDA